MPYKKSYGKRYPRKARKAAGPSKKVKSFVRREIRKEDRKDHPIEYCDVLFTGDYVKTTPSLLSFGEAVKNQIVTSASYDNWPVHRNPQSGGNAYFHQANVFITGYHYQLRFKQNDAATAPTTDTVRCLFYSLDDTYAENAVPLLNGADIDQPPLTESVRRMHSDVMRTLRASTTEISTDDTQFVPGQTVLKGTKKLNHKLMLNDYDSTLSVMEGGDIRQEMQSDDNSLVGNVEVYGFIRIYYRVMA